MRPPRETYVRTSRPCENTRVVLEPGVEFRPGDDFDAMTHRLYLICVWEDKTYPQGTPMELAEAVAAVIARVWPDRAYFVEAHDAAGWIQIFQPYGVPKNEA